MSGGPSKSRLPLPVVPRQQFHPQTEASSPTPAPSNSTSLSTGSPPQLRRLRTHLQAGRRVATRAQVTSSRNFTADFDPEAAEFVPNPKMPPKRKASSMGRSGKSTLSTPRNNTSNQQSLDHPIIRPEDIFGRGALAKLSYEMDGIIDDESDSAIFEIEPIMPIMINAANRDRNRNRDQLRVADAMQLMRSRMANVGRAPDLIQSNAAILFSYEGDGSTEESNDSARLRYLPLCPATTSGWRDSVGKDTPLTVLPRHRERIDGTSSTPLPTKASWPQDELPMELFDLIAGHLSRDAVKSMRLVNKEFEKKVSSNLFHTSVVPFNTELYDMIDEDTRAFSRASRPAKDKGKAGPWDLTGQSADLHGLHWTNAKYDAEGKVYKGHGLRVFQGFGPHIRRFGMSFDVLEGQLSRPPIKRELDHVESYHGSYDWPPERYTRFANLAGLEKTADETLRMKSAFSHLENVHDLALSVDSGLGWLNGPDKSIHARVFQRQSPIFGHSRLVPDYQTQDANEFWATVQSCNRNLGANINHKEISLVRRPLPKNPSEISGLRGTRYSDMSLWSSITASMAAPTVSTTASGPTVPTSPIVTEDLPYGLMHTTFATPDSTTQSLYDKSALVPSELRKEQKEWLLETEWAQRAFLECYMLAVMDNPGKFAKVRTLSIAKISSGFLPLLARESFWDALPNLTDVTILVKPDWRTVERDNAGFAETCPQNPSEAVRTFHRCILRDRLCLRPIKKLNIGWATGGEHADGIFARNNHIMPAPISQLEHTTAAIPNSGLVFKYVEHLTLTNCWITPPMLEDLVKSHAEKSLKKLTLNSVSLTAHPRFPAGGQGAVQQHVAQAHVLLPNAAGPPNAQNPPPLWIPMGVQQGINVNQQQQQQQYINTMVNNGQQNMNAPTNNNAAHALTQHALNNPVQTAQTHTHWSADHREGSWPEVLNTISPGPIFTDYLPQPLPWEEQHPPRPPTSLRTLELKSCGYAKLYHSTAFDQFAIEAGGHDHHLSLWFRNRQAALSPAMLTNTDRYLGRIIQYMPRREQEALIFAWGCTVGWENHEKAEEAEYDGLLKGGTGRFSGMLVEGMEIVGGRGGGQQQV